MPQQPTLQDMRLVSCVELDRRTVLLTVIESWVTERWSGLVGREQQRSYTLLVGVGRWLDDAEHFVLQPDPRHFRLMEIWAASMAEQKIDEYIAASDRDPMPNAQESARGPLPPVPLLPPPRKPLRRLGT